MSDKTAIKQAMETVGDLINQDCDTGSYRSALVDKIAVEIYDNQTGYIINDLGSIQGCINMAESIVDMLFPKHNTSEHLEKNKEKISSLLDGVESVKRIELKPRDILWVNANYSTNREDLQDIAALVRKFLDMEGYENPVICTDSINMGVISNSE